MRYLLLLILLALPVQAAEETVGTILILQAEVPDVAKLEVKAIDVLTARYGLTRAEAREKVRVNGLTSVQRCLDYIVTDLLNGITQARITASSMVAEPLKTDQIIP